MQPVTKKVVLKTYQDDLAKLDDEKYANAVDPQYGITNRNLIALKILSYYSQPEVQEKPSEIEKAIVQSFLKSIKGDMELNSALKAIAQTALIGTGLNGTIISNILAYTYKTRHINTFNSAFDKLNRNYERALNGEDIDDEDRISLAEYSSIYDVAKLHSLMEPLKQIGFFDGDPILEEFSDRSNKCLEILEKIESDFKDSQVAKPGKLTFDHTEKKSFVMTGKCLSFFELLIAKLITKHGHASKLYSEASGSFVSHINPDPINEKFDMRSYLYTDIYRIKIETLIAPEQQAKLKEAFGDNWLTVVNGMYAEIEREIHDNTVGKFSNLSASSESEQYKAGISSLLPFGLGHKKFAKNDFNVIREQVFSQFYTTGQHKLLCSEFVAHTTIAALMELNRRLELELLKKPIKPEGRIVKIPFDQHEDLHRMHPDRLLYVLKKAGCIEEESDIPLVSSLFVRKTKKAPKHHDKTVERHVQASSATNINYLKFSIN